MSETTVVVLGVGNTLMQDDGVGVHAVRLLGEQYELPARVQLIDGGVAGFAWLDELAADRFLVIVDAVRGPGAPGTTYRLTPRELACRPGWKLSAHEIGVVEVLALAEVLGKLPPTAIVGVQPLETTTLGLKLTPPVRQALPDVVQAVVQELRAVGIDLKRRAELVPGDKV